MAVLKARSAGMPMECATPLRQCLMLAVVIMSSSCMPQSGQSGSLTEPSVVSPIPIPSDFVWRSVEELGVWASNAVSRNCELVVDGGSQFIRIRVGPDSFTLRGPDLPADSPPIKGVRIVYRFQPAETEHRLNVIQGIVVPWQKRYENDRALLAYGLNWQSWIASEGGPISSGGPPFVAHYVYFTAESGVTPGTLDIQSIELTR